MAQVITIESNWQSVVFHCPVCGSEVCSEDGRFTEKPCPHLLFSWIGEECEFYNASKEMARVIGDQAETDDDSLSPAPWDEEFLKHCPEDAVLFAFEHHEMACGPVCTTIVHAIEFPSNE